jgi:putative hemolysin
MSSLALEVFVILVFIATNGLFAMSEIAVVSSRRVRLQQRAEEGDAGARAALDLLATPSRFLSTVQVGITLVGVLAGAFGGATLSERIAPLVEQIPWLAPYSEAISVGVVVLVISYLSLVLGELVPKRLALNNAERIASRIARPMQWLARVASPMVRLLTLSTELILRVLRVRPTREPLVTEEEVRIMIEQGRQVGVFEALEQEMVAQVFRLSDQKVSALITPRTEIVWLDVEDTFEEMRRKIVESGHSLFPVARGNLDHIQGIVRAKDLLAQCLSGQALDLQAVMTQPQFVPEGMAALDVLDRFRADRSRVALVIDEYGGCEGLLTVNDILDAIAGDIPELGVEIVPEAVQREDGSWSLDGMFLIDEFQELFDIRELPDEGERRYQTLGGFVMAQMGSIPRIGDRFEWGGLRFEVTDMDGRRVDRVVVTREDGVERQNAN